MFAFRWHQADSVLRLVTADWFLNQIQYFLVIHLDRVSNFNIRGKNKINDQYDDRKYNQFVFAG